MVSPTVQKLRSQREEVAPFKIAVAPEAASIAAPDNAADLPKFPFCVVHPIWLSSVDFGRQDSGPIAVDLSL